MIGWFRFIQNYYLALWLRVMRKIAYIFICSLLILCFIFKKLIDQFSLLIELVINLAYQINALFFQNWRLLFCSSHYVAIEVENILLQIMFIKTLQLLFAYLNFKTAYLSVLFLFQMSKHYLKLLLLAIWLFIGNETFNLLLFLELRW